MICVEKWLNILQFQVINLAREPRWGRNIEVPGEDPLVVGEYELQKINYNSMSFFGVFY